MRSRVIALLKILTIAGAAMFLANFAFPRAVASAPHTSSDSVKQELTAVIDAQLAAIRANDYPKAYTFAADAIRGMFKPGDFEVMVKTGFPIIAQSSHAEYGLAFDTGEEAVVNVRVETADKRSIQYQYLLKKEQEGWKISGVAELKPEGLSV